MVGRTEGFKRKRRTNGKSIWNSREGRRARKTGQQLFPGIPDDITIRIISPKLSWAMLPTLATVSCGWLQAFRDGKILEARAFANSTRTIFVHCKQESEDLRFTLYSVEDNSVYSIPGIPAFNSSNLKSFTHAFVNGRLYVFGCTESEFTLTGGTHKYGKRQRLFTYEFDLARLRGWRKCTISKSLNAPHDCAVMGDKVFVCDVYAKCALYDPDADIWSPVGNFARPFIPPIISAEPYQKVLAGAGLQEGLVYQHGPCRELHGTIKTIKWIKNFELDGCSPFFSFPSGFEFPYRSVEQEVKTGQGMAVVLLDGRFFRLTEQHIDAYDNHTNTWTPLQFEGPFDNHFIDEDSRLQRFISSTTFACDVAVVRIKSRIYSVMDVSGRTPSYSSNQRKLFLMKKKIPIQGSEGQESSTSQQNFALDQWKQVECKLSLSKGFLRCPIQL